MHSPVAKQQAPVGAAQVFGSQTPNAVQVPVQPANSVTAQVPSAAQQDPVGWAHGFGVQTPASVHVAGQSACAVSVQAPDGAQHAPVGAGVGGLVSPPQPANTVTTTTAPINSLRMVSPPSCRPSPPGRSDNPLPPNKRITTARNYSRFVRTPG